MKNKFIKQGGCWLGLLIAVVSFSCTSNKIDSELRRAEELKGTRKFSEAIQVYELITINYPNDKKTAVAHLRMGDLYRHAFQKEDKAQAAYAFILDRWPFVPEAAEAAIKYAEISKANGQSRRAIEKYSWFLKNFPKHDKQPYIRLLLAEEYLSLADPYQASVELEALMKSEGLAPDIHAKAIYNLGESYLFLKRYKEALDNFTVLKEKYPQVPFLLDAQFRMMECLEKLDRPEEVIALQEQLVQENPDSELVKRKAEALIRREEKIEKPDVAKEKDAK